MRPTAGRIRPLLFVWHHLIADGWSRGIFVSELAQLYADQRARLAPIKTHYLDYVHVQQGWFAGEACARQLAYWQEQLANLHPQALPSESASIHADKADFSSETLTLTLDEPTRDALSSAAKRHKLTSFVLLLTAYSLLLHRYNGRSDIAFAIPVAGRQPGSLKADQELGPLIGFFVNTVVLRMRPATPDCLSSWIDAVKNTLSDALDHQHVPLAKIAQAIGRQHLFDSMFQYQNEAYAAQNTRSLDACFEGLEVAQNWVKLAQTKFAMTWHVIERDDSVFLAVEYQKSYLPRARVEGLMASFSLLLSNMLEIMTEQAANSAIGIDQIDYLSARRRDDLLSHASLPGRYDSATPWQSLVARFEQQALRGAARPAAVSQDNPDQCLSYGQLDRRANALAAKLIALGAGRVSASGEGPVGEGPVGVSPVGESLVGVSLPRKPDLLVALLGIMKAGAAYVPLEPTLPDQRLSFMIQDAGIKWVVGDEPDRACFAGVSLISPEQGESRGLIQKRIEPDQLAYCIYTSGSSGKPKGTLLTHRGLMHYLDWCKQRYPLSHGKGSLVSTSIGFDATITTLFSPLLVGKAVHLIQQDSITDILMCLDQNFSILKLTPAHLAALQPLVKIKLEQERLDAGKLPAAMILGGEALSEAHVDFWRCHFPEIQLINEYGPTETVVGCAYYRVQEQDRSSIPIGRGIAGSPLYVLDQYMQLVPYGVPGNLYIGGPAMARGYLSQPALTARRFIPDPFSGRPGAVMYDSGDRALWREDGQLAYLGREDQQLKLRGYRIEAGEVESTLCQSPLIDIAVVHLRNKQLVAYLKVIDQGIDQGRRHDDWLRKLEAELAQTLPKYMVPSAFVLLDEIPLTVNGKVNHSQLRKLPLLSRTRYDEEASAPGSERARLLLQTWRQVLNRQDISVYDNFFDLGGDSVSAMQIVSRMHQHGYQLEPSAVFEYQTISAQAPMFLPTTQRQFKRPEGLARLSPMQWSFFRRLDNDACKATRHHYNQSVLLDIDSECFKEQCDEPILEQALNVVAARHDVFRMRFNKTENTWQGRFTDQDGELVLEHWQGSAELLEQKLCELQRSLNIEEGPLARACLLRTGDGQLRLALIAHHLIVDGVSWRTLLDDLVHAFETLRRGKTLSLDPGINFEHLNQLTDLESGLFDQEIPYWNQATESVPGLPFAHDKRCHSRQFELNLKLDHDNSSALRQIASKHPLLSLDSLLITAFQPISWRLERPAAFRAGDGAPWSRSDQSELAQRPCGRGLADSRLSAQNSTACCDTPGARGKCCRTNTCSAK